MSYINATVRDPLTDKDPLSTFRYKVLIEEKAIAIFTECTLPKLKWETEPIREGGLNSWVHQLPKNIAATTITLKAGIGLSRDLFMWYANSFNLASESLSADFAKAVRKTVAVEILDSTRSTIYTVYAQDAYPIEWNGPNLNGGEGKTVAIETLTIACGQILMGLN
jgi:phage tail-like protein